MLHFNHILLKVAYWQAPLKLCKWHCIKWIIIMKQLVVTDNKTALPIRGHAHNSSRITIKTVDDTLLNTANANHF